MGSLNNITGWMPNLKPAAVAAGAVGFLSILSRGSSSIARVAPALCTCVRVHEAAICAFISVATFFPLIEHRPFSSEALHKFWKSVPGNDTIASLLNQTNADDAESEVQEESDQLPSYNLERILSPLKKPLPKLLEGMSYLLVASAVGSMGSL